MDEGKILVVNLSKGLIGEDNAGILGAFLVTKIQLAAMSRSDIPDVANRRPFYLYVDEFQNFATDSFAVILSEARKYGLNLTVANQYIAQMTDSVREAVFGNVGTTISFRVAPEDAGLLVKQFEPTFDESDLIQMNNRHFVISMIINGEKVPAFSATSLNLPNSPKDNLPAIIESSRAQYSRRRADVEKEISETIEQAERYKKELSDSGRAAGEQGNTSAGQGTKPKQNPNKPGSPQYEFKKLKLSPNAAEEKTNRPGLKDLSRLVAEQQGEAKDVQTGNKAPVNDPSKPSQKPSKAPNKRNHNRNRKNTQNALNRTAKAISDNPSKNQRRKEITEAFASDLHDGKPNVASSQNLPTGDDDNENLGYLSIHH